MSLDRYQKKRDFRRTSEPRGAGRKKCAGGWKYVIQKHAASHLHYDFRLQIGDVLKSWAVPKGPSLDPDVKRLAVHVEDHPLEYGSFEGTIPAGEYGGGTVMIWDEGTWEMSGDPQQAYREGKLHFTLHGEKLRGEWVLVKRGGKSGRRGGSDGDKEPWFLFKIRDAAAREGDDNGVLQREPDSAASGRTMEEIAAGKRVRKSSPKSKHSAGPRNSRSATNRPRASGSTWQLLESLPGAKKGPLPRKIRPQLATLVKTAPSGDEWFNEIKFDGYRMICHLVDHKVTFTSRNGHDWTKRVAQLVPGIRSLKVQSAVLDGEVVALEADGRSSFQGLQNAFSGETTDSLVYYVFDVLYLNGINLTRVPLEDRKALLAELVPSGLGAIRDAGYIVGQGPRFFGEACKRHLEGIICKRRDRPYRPGRSSEWIKVKCEHREEFVIGGFTPPAGSRIGFGALLLGYYDGDKLHYAGRVGTGFSDDLLEELAPRLEKIEQQASPFVDLQGKTGQARGVRWLKPKLVAQVTFGEWTRDGHLRHPAFQGLREDKPAAQVTREKPIPLTQVKSESMTKPSRGKVSKTSPSNKILVSVRLTHPDKVLYPGEQITKADLAGYYASIADWILPHVVDRPLTLVRCPKGIGGKCFYQKHGGKGFPEAIEQIGISDKSGKIEYPLVKDLAGLLGLVQMNTLEIHAWGARIDNVEKPDRLVFDLDPDAAVPWKRVVESAQQLRQFLTELDLACFVKTTGGKGLHLVVPIERRTTWDDARETCRAIAEAVALADPARYTVNMSKAARGGKIFLDYLRNSRGATAVVPYSTRAREHCPISMPISWEDLADLKSAAQFTIGSVPARLARQKRDPWRDIDKVRQALSKSLLKKLRGI